jgi:hypothetical protein
LTEEATQLTKRNYTIKEVMALNLFQFSERTLRRMIAEKKIAVKRVGSGRGSIWIPKTEIERVVRMS